ncbi:MAG: glycine zipper 2TM domain-containing protein [Limnobacter sp.]|nr:glycine zipper 2TM domain-containing protein [Limnobacter sp.]
MKLNRLLTVVSFAVMATAFTGCATQSSSSNVYREGDTMRAQSVQMGTVESVREVTIQGKNSGAGGTAGAVIGGIAGSNVGKGRGSAVGTVLGAVAGGVLGKKAEDGVTSRTGLEITVQLDSGGMRAIVQDADVRFRSGDRVRILTSNGKARVTY